MKVQREIVGNDVWGDPLQSEPLCIRFNLLAEDGPAPESPDGTKMSIDHLVYTSSPKSVLGLFDSNTEWESEGKHETKAKNKKKKRRKKKLFGSRKKEEESSPAVSPIQQPLNLKKEEEHDFVNLRREEATRPKLDNLVAYPTTLMEEVMSMPIPTTDKVENEQDAEECETKTEGPEQLQNCGRFQEDVRRLKVSQMELRHFLSDEDKFSRLQKDLRKLDCITNETLRQKLHVFCRANIDKEEDSSALRDIFSEPIRRRGWNNNAAQAYRRMNEFTREIDWKQSIEEDLGITGKDMQSKKKWSDTKLLHLVSNYSKKGRESHYNKFQDGVEEKGMLEHCDKIGIDGMLQEGVEDLKYCAYDLVPIVEADEAFTNLQKQLREIGAVTNGVLKQGLHFYVKDIKLKKELEKAALAAEAEQKEESLRDCINDVSKNEDMQRHRRTLLKKLLSRPRRKHTKGVIEKQSNEYSECSV